MFHCYNQRLCRDSILHISDTRVCVQITLTILKPCVCVRCNTRLDPGSSICLNNGMTTVVYRFAALLQPDGSVVSVEPQGPSVSAGQSHKHRRVNTTVHAGLTSLESVVCTVCAVVRVYGSKLCVKHTVVTHAVTSTVHDESKPAAQHDNHSPSYVLKNTAMQSCQQVLSRVCVRTQRKVNDYNLQTENQSYN